MNRREMFVGGLVAAFAAPSLTAAPAPVAVTTYVEASPTLAALYFAKLVANGVMTSDEARSHLSRPSGPDWPRLPVSVEL